MRSHHTRRAPRRHVTVLVTIVALAGTAAAGFFFLHRADQPPLQVVATEQAAASPVRPDPIQAGLARCSVYPPGPLKHACEQFVRQHCPSLLAHDAWQETAASAARDRGLRLIPLQPPQPDPFHPIDCYQQWWLTEAAFDLPIPVGPSHGSHRNLAPPQQPPRSISDYPGFSSESPLYFAHRDADGRLRPPANYGIEQRYSPRDQRSLGVVLEAAYAYADVNAAIRDGYAPQPFFSASMGIHFSNLSLFDDTIDLRHPEFLTYIKSSTTNAYALAQVGYIMARDNRFQPFTPSLFDAAEARGHHHYLACVFVDDKGWWKTGLMAEQAPVGEEMRLFLGSKDGEVAMRPADAIALYANMKSNRFKNPYRVGCFDTLWMMHVAVNLYNAEGLFADAFPLIDAMSRTGELYSLFGRKFDLRDYTAPANGAR
jgi:hypothetical protein